MAAYEKGRLTKQRAEDRLNDWLSKEMESEDKTKQAAEGETGEKDEEEKEYAVDDEHVPCDGAVLSGENDRDEASSSSNGAAASPAGEELGGDAELDSGVGKRECSHTPLKEIKGGFVKREAQTRTEDGMEKRRAEGQRAQKKRQAVKGSRAG